MEKLKINLEYCYGIKKMTEEIDFSEQNVIAIYAPNGSMKSSLAQTFLDLSNGEKSKDRFFPSRITNRKITDENDIDSSI
jgi:ABC-type Mn2+/Zn2+ transport system ATPase subunit